MHSQSVYDEGVDAYENGFTINYNPYDKGSNEFDSWNCGFLDARDFAIYTPENI